MPHANLSQTTVDRFGNRLYCFWLLTHGHRDGGHANRAATKTHTENMQNRAVEPVETPGIHLEHLEGRVGSTSIGDALPSNLSPVLNPTQ